MINIPILFVGSMGSGKTTMSNIIAELNNIGWRDIDDELSFQTRISIELIFRFISPDQFRKWEFDVISCLRNKTITSLGGGAVLLNQTRIRIQTQLIYHVDCSFNKLNSNLLSDYSRPHSVSFDSFTMRTALCRLVPGNSIRLPNEKFFLLINSILRILDGQVQ